MILIGGKAIEEIFVFELVSPLDMVKHSAFQHHVANPHRILDIGGHTIIHQHMHRLGTNEAILVEF